MGQIVSLLFYKDGFIIKWTKNGRYAIKQKSHCLLRLSIWLGKIREISATKCLAMTVNLDVFNCKQARFQQYDTSKTKQQELKYII